MAVKFKLSSAAKRVKTGFEPYDGPEVTKAGIYRAILKKLKYEKKSSDNYGFNIVFELEAAEGDPKGHAVYDGAPFFSRSIVTQMADGSALKEGAQRNLDNFLNALGVSANPEVVCEDGDVDEQAVEVKKIGGKSPIGTAVNLEIQIKKYGGEDRAEIGSIFATSEDKKSKKAAPLPKARDEEDEEDEDEEDLLDGSSDPTLEEREAELKKMSVKEIREIAEGDYDLEIKGLKKDALIEAILEHEFEVEDEDLEEDEDDEDIEEEDDFEEEDDEEDDEEEESDEDIRREELSGKNRIQLKKILKELDASARVKTKDTEEDIIEKIVELEFELPF